MGATPEELKAEIDRTRAELAADVDTLADRVSPTSAAKRGAGRVAAGATALKERVMGSAEDLRDTAATTVTSTAQDVKESVMDRTHSTTEALASTTSAAGDALSSAGSSIAGAVASAPAAATRQTQGNPVAAGLIAFGAGLLAASLLPTSRKEEELALQAKDKAGELAQPVVQAAKDSAQQAVQELRPATEHALAEVKGVASDAATTTLETAKSGAGETASTTTAALSDVKEELVPSGAGTSGGPATSGLHTSTDSGFGAPSGSTF